MSRPQHCSASCRGRRSHGLSRGHARSAVVTISKPDPNVLSQNPKLLAELACAVNDAGERPFIANRPTPPRPERLRMRRFPRSPAMMRTRAASNSWSPAVATMLARASTTTSYMAAATIKLCDTLDVAPPRGGLSDHTMKLRQIILVSVLAANALVAGFAQAAPGVANPHQLALRGSGAAGSR